MPRLDGGRGGDERRLAPVNVADLRAGEAGGALWELFVSVMANEQTVDARCPMLDARCSISDQGLVTE